MAGQHRKIVAATVLGMAGAAGLAWTAAALIAAYLPQREDLLPEDIAAPDTQYLKIDGRLVAYREAGAGDKTVVLLHGFSCDMQSWNSLQPMLAGNYRTVALDLWGFGASARPATLTPTDWQQEIFGVLERLHISSAAFIGHSMGGRIAMMCAASAPERVRSLGLIDCDGVQAPPIHTLLRLTACTPTLRISLRQLRRDPDELITYLRRCYGPNYPITDDLIFRYLRPLCVQGTEACWAHLGPLYPGASFAQLTTQIACPSLLIWGADDRVTPAQRAINLVQSLPSAELIIIPHAGHLPHETQPELVFSYLHTFLANTFRH